ncbi:hypothetical protein [Ruegeria arenilitoris]|uniref:hypothetical protein n=1 Tax=Ruegeria arenilitoris TaxID=1173585 RepID=UPI00147D0C00|nr:hypothetical protein [Ruegeria arenilitoris]
MFIGLALYSFVGTLLGFLVGLLFPALSFLMFFLIMASSTVLPTLIGTRMGLQAKGVQPSTRLRGLFLPAMIYGAVEGLSATLIIGLVIAFSVAVISPDLLQQNEVSDLVLQYADTPWVGPGMLSLVVVFLSVCSIRASLLVPITSASIGRDPDGLHYTPFRHFRASFGPLFGLTIFSYVGMIAMHAVLIAVLILSGFAESLHADLLEFGDMTQGTATIRPLWSLLGLFFIYMLIGTWAFSLQCAGGVLGYLHLRDSGPRLSDLIEANQKAAKDPKEQSAPRMSAEDLRALRKSRETGNR